MLLKNRGFGVRIPAGECVKMFGKYDSERIATNSTNSAAKTADGPPLDLDQTPRYQEPESLFTGFRISGTRLDPLHWIRQLIFIADSRLTIADEEENSVTPGN